jgi:hypothetical protein
MKRLDPGERLLDRRPSQHPLAPGLEMRPIVEVIPSRRGNQCVGKVDVRKVRYSGPILQRNILLARIAEPALQDAILVADGIRESAF